MELANGEFTVTFEGGILLPVEPTPIVQNRRKIAWLLKSVDVTSASTRYRCYHFATALSAEYDSEYFASTYDLQDRIREFDAIIVVKRVDKTLASLAAQAAMFKIPLFLDFCDDMLAPTYVKNAYGVNLVRFMGLVPFIAGVTAPSAEMADRIKGYASKYGFPNLPVHVVPDIAESWDLYRAAHAAITGEELSAELPAPSPSSSIGRKRVVWFGNYGASHSNFGIFSLRPSLKSLRIINHEIPLELVVISNNEAVYDALVHECGFPTRYVPWSAPAVYSELAAADAALLTTGDDEFCDIKSSSRVLQALAAGVPVITVKSPAVVEFEDAIALGRMRDALRSSLGPASVRFVPPRLAAAQRSLARYTPEQVAGIWSLLLDQAIAAGEAGREAEVRDKVLIVLEPGDNVARAGAMMAAVKRLPKLDYVLLVSTQLLADQPMMTGVLRQSRNLPRFFNGELEGVRNLLLGCGAVVVDRQSAPVASSVAVFANELGVPLLTTEDAATGALETVGKSDIGQEPPRNGIKAGPYPQHFNADGTVDWAFITSEKARGWILDAICQEIGSRQPSSWCMSYVPGPVPEAKNYFFSHYALFENFIDAHADKINGRNIFVWYTHPRTENPVSVAKLLVAFDRVTKVIFACESNRRIWLERGLPEEKTAVVLGAADADLFRSHERGDGVIGLSSSFYERKNPDCLLQLIELLPHRQFVLLGRKWNQYALFEKMKARPNFTYLSAPYRDYPDIYATFDVFLSMSTLEGGPIPLVEAMMSNAVPVASRTGFAPDLIDHGRNGFIFDLDAPAAEIADLIEAAFANQGYLRSTDTHLSWYNFSDSVVRLADD
jgi:glycosyltransferase involved in cell wall biosynthesis